MDKYPFSLTVKYSRELDQKEEKDMYLYFKVRRRSGGGECDIIKLNPTQYRVSYKNKEVMDRVLNYPDHKKELCGKQIDFTLEAEEDQEKANVESPSREKQINEDAFSAPTIPEESSENMPLEQNSFILLDSNFQYEVIKERVENEICTSFPFLKIHCDNKMLKLAGHGDLMQARLLAKNMVASVRERKVDVPPAIAGFLILSDSADISKKLFDISNEGLVFLDLSRGLRLYASSDTLLDQAEITLQQSLLASNIQITPEEGNVTSQEDWKHLLDTFNSSGDIQVALQEDSDSKGFTLSLVGLSKAVEEASKMCKHYLCQKTLVKELVDLQHRIVAENIEPLLMQFGGGQLSVTIQVSKPPEHTVILTGSREEVKKSKAILQEFIQKIHVNNLCIIKHGAAHFFHNTGREILDKLQDIFKCRIYICDSENEDHRAEGASNDQNAPEHAEYVNLSDDVNLTGSTSCNEGKQQAERCETMKKQEKAKETKPSPVQLVLSCGKLENKVADVLVAPLLSNKLALEALNVTKSLKQRGGELLKNLFTAALNNRPTLEPGSIFQLQIPGEHYHLNCDLVIFVVCLPWDGPSGSASITALKKGVKNMLETCNSKKKKSIAMSVLGPGLKLKFPEVTAAKLIGEEIRLFVENAQNLSLQKIELLIPWEYRPLFITYRETLLHMDLGDRLILCNENGGSFNKISFGQRHQEKVGNLSINVVYNDITKENTDAIVNSTNFSTWNRNTVANAIFTAAGPSIVQEAKTGASRTEIVQTTQGSLPCKFILHCNCKSRLENIPNLVKDILLHCERTGMKSVAIPAIGTGECGFKPVDVAIHFVNAISFYARTRNIVSLTCVNLVTVHPHIYHIFCAQLKKHLVFSSQDSWKPVDLLTSRLKQLWLPKCDAIQDITFFQHPINLPPVALLVIVTDQLGNVNEIKQCLKEEFDKQYKEEKIEQALLKTFSLEEIQDVFSVVNEKPEINMVLDKQENCILIKGGEKDVLEAALKVQTKLTANISARLHNIATEPAGFLVQWGYSDDEDSYSFSLEASRLLEGRYQARGTEVVTVTLENGKVATVNLRTMKATIEGNNQEVGVIRRDLNNEIKLPMDWVDMSGLLFMIVELDHSSEEFKGVQANFRRTVPKNIVKIERIQNKYQYIAYAKRKEYMIMKNGPDGVNECDLFHGTEPQNCQSISYSGFNRSFAGQHAAAFGNGVYFAMDASYSAALKYSPPDPNTGERFMYRAKVLVGHHTIGQRGMRTPPCRQANDPFDVYDSLTDNQNNPAMFVAFHDDQAYPEYLITFK